jgi:hypothetical protein
MILGDFSFPSPLPVPFMPLEPAGFPLGGPAIRQPGGRDASPMVMASDGLHDIVGYSFSPQTGFTELVRIRDRERTLTTPPIVLPDGNTAVGTLEGSMIFTGPTLNTPGATGSLGMLTAAPTRLYDGRLAVVNRSGRLRLLSGGSVTHSVPLNGDSIASAGASCTHLFVSTTEELVTFDVQTMMPVARIAWHEPLHGGFHAPVIGPTGYVYVIGRILTATSDVPFDILYVFPGPKTPWGDTMPPQGCGKVAKPAS